MINTRKKLGAFLIAMMMVLPLFAFVTMIETKAALQGSGTAEDPYQIFTIDDLKSIPSVGREYHYILMNDLDFKNEGELTTLSNKSNPFMGTFDGNGKVLKNITMVSALFHGVEGGTIKGLGIENCVIGYSNITGPFAGYFINSNMYECYSTNLSISNGSNAGGVAGLADGSVIEKCYSSGIISAQGSSSSHYGGILGHARASTMIKDCYSTISINNTGGAAGGLTGSLSSDSQIINSYAVGDITANAYVGGLAGIYNTSRIESSVSINRKVEQKDKSNNTIGRIAAGINLNNTLHDNLAYDDMIIMINGKVEDIESTNPSADSHHGQNTTIEELRQQSTYEALDWDFDNVWYMDGYPKLQFTREGGTTDPDTETVTINDTVTGKDNNQIEYAGNWFHQTQSGNYMDDEHVTNTPDSAFLVRFNGNGIKWYGAFALDRGVAAIYIDDEFIQYVNCYDPNYQPGALLFDSGPIDTGQHTLKVVLIPFKHIEAIENYITVDKIEIESVK